MQRHNRPERALRAFPTKGTAAGTVENCMRYFRTALTAAVVAVGTLASAPVFAETLTYKIALSPANEVPPVPTRATGSADVTYDTVTRVVTWNITHSGLSGAATAAHFHGPATPL